MNSAKSDKNGSIRLYRYMGANVALNTIERRAFRVGRIRELNDPFEWRPGITGIITEGKPIARSLLDSFINDMSEQIGVLSFSDTSEDAVLWSHYADRHQGVAFEVDQTIGPEHLFKMEYTNERPLVDANRLRDSAGLDDYLRPLIYQLMKQKSPGWSYEREYRVFLGLESCDISAGHYFRRIPDNYLKRVILGFKCPFEPAYVSRALAINGLEDTVVVRAQMCLETYAIQC